jgi:hypothetical protein
MLKWICGWKPKSIVTTTINTHSMVAPHSVVAGIHRTRQYRKRITKVWVCSTVGAGTIASGIMTFHGLKQYETGTNYPYWGTRGETGTITPNTSIPIPEPSSLFLIVIPIFVLLLLKWKNS